MTSRFSYREILQSVRSRVNEVDQLIASTNSIISDNPDLRHQLNTAKSCLLVGPGQGIVDLAFVEQFLPEIRHVIAVEPDAECAVELRSQISQRISRLESADVHQMRVQAWDPTEDLFDVVLLFHVLYHVTGEERQHLASKLQEVVSPGGVVLVLISVPGADGSPDVNAFLSPSAASRCFVDAQDVLKTMTSAGFYLTAEKRHTITLNLRDLDDAFLSLHLCDLGEIVELDQVRAAYSQLTDGLSSVYQDWLGVFTRSMT